MNRRPLSPTPLHLLRLAQAAGGVWVSLPGSAGKVVAPAPRLTPQAGSGWLLSLHGECVVDLAEGGFARLRPGEAVGVTPGWSALALTDGATLLLLTPT